MSMRAAYLGELDCGIGRCRVVGVGLEVDSHQDIHIVAALDGHSQVVAAAKRLLVKIHSLS